MTPVDAFFLYTEAGGLVMQAEKEGPGSKLLLQLKKSATDPQVATQLFTLRDGVLSNVGDNLVVDYRDNAVMLWTPQAGSATQQWALDSQGKVTSPGVPGLVMRATRTDQHANHYLPGAVVTMATDTPYYPGESEWFRRWDQLWVSERRSLFCLSGVVMSGTSPEKPAPADGSVMQLWYPARGMFVNDGASGKVLCAQDLGSGRDYRIPIVQLPSGQQGWTSFQVQEAERRIANPSSGTYLDYLPHATPTGTNEFRPAGQGGDYRWCFGNGPHWQWVPGELIDISVGSDGFVAGVTKERTLVYYIGGGRWRPLPGGLKDIVDVAVGSRSMIWALESTGLVRQFTAEGPAYWKIVFGPGLSSVSVALTGTAWGVDHEGRIRRYLADQDDWLIVTPEWQRTKGHIDQISTTSDRDVWATAKDGQIWWFDPDLGTWESVPGSLERVSTGADGSAWGVTSTFQTYRYAGDATEDWHQEPALFDRISVGAARFIWALGPGGVYRYSPGEGAAPTAPTAAATRLGDPVPPPSRAPNASAIQEALLCAHLSQAAYAGTEQGVSAAIQPYGYRVTNVFHDVATQTFGYLAVNDETCDMVLAFRGTSTMENVNTDLWQDLAPIDFLGDAVQVVKGFDHAYTSVERAVISAVTALLQDGYLISANTFYITGHSLGGALATIGALQMAQTVQQMGRSGLVKLITFAAPAIGNPAFRMYYGTQTYMFAAIAYVSQNDAVATGEWWTPFGTLDLKAMGRVSPVPTIYYFNDELGMPDCHYLDHYIAQLTLLANRATAAIRNIVVQVTTGDLGDAPWWWFDKAGTSRDVDITLGRRVTGHGGEGGRVNQILRPAANDWNWERTGTGFEIGQSTSFGVTNTLGLTQDDVQQVRIGIDCGGLNFLTSDNWLLAGLKITVDGLVRYDNPNVNVWLGPSYTDSWTADIPPLL